MRRAIVLAAVLAAAACETTAPDLKAGPEEAPVRDAGPARINDCDSLVPIEAEDTSQGLARELAWLRANYPGAEVVNQGPADCAGTPADRIVFTADGETRVVLFDASSFFGVVDGTDLDALLDG